MQDKINYVLQIVDSLTGRKLALRIYAEDSALPLGQLLDKYLKGGPIGKLLDDGRITADSAEALLDIQDFDDFRKHP